MMGTEPQGKESWQEPVMQPHRARLILGLGIAAVAVDIGSIFYLFILLPLVLVFGLDAVISGQRDLGRMRRGEMDARGMAMTRLGRTLGIISLLVAIAFGWYLVVGMHRAERRTGTNVCVANERQLAEALQMYAKDYNGHLPQAADWAPILAASSYIDNLRLLKCWEERGNARSSYGMNIALSGKRLADLVNPAEVVLLYETARPGTSPNGGAEDVVRPGRHILTASFSSPTGSVFAFADGHVQWIKDGEAVNFVPKWKKPG
jgi:prepilin-type processing-associated H-X9-DG protein